ncbi:MAG: hypothetical protein AB1425_02455 [Actinomycetota bacterium]
MSRLFDLLGNPGSVLVLHMGGAHDDRGATTVRFIEMMRPETGVLRYLALENDERVWSVPEIVETVSALEIPAICDVFHHALNPTGLSLRRLWIRRCRPGRHGASVPSCTSPARTRQNSPARTLSGETPPPASSPRGAGRAEGRRDGVEAKGEETALDTLGLLA